MEGRQPLNSNISDDQHDNDSGSYIYGLCLSAQGFTSINNLITTCAKHFM